MRFVWVIVGLVALSGRGGVAAPPAAPEAGQDGWTNPLTSVVLGRDALRGKWVRDSKTIRHDESSAWRVAGWLKLPPAPRGSYEFQASFVRSTGSSLVGFVLPVGDFATTLALGRMGGEYHVLKDVDGKDPNTASSRPGKLTNGKTYNVAVTVGRSGAAASIAVKLNGKEIIRWQGLAASLSTGDTLGGHVGLVASNSVRFSKVRFRELPTEAPVPLGRDAKEIAAAIFASDVTDTKRAARLYDAAMAASDDDVRAELAERALEYAVRGASIFPARAVGYRALKLLARRPERLDNWASLGTSLHRVPYAREKEPAQKAAAGRKLLRHFVRVANRYRDAREWGKAADVLLQANSLAGSMKWADAATIQQWYDRARPLAEAEKKAQGYARMLKGRPENTQARLALLRILVVDLNAPAAAASSLSDDVGEIWQTYVPLAVKPVAELPEPVCLELGNWYAKALLKEASSPGARRFVLVRARAYYQRFLELHTDQDAPRLSASMSLTVVADELSKLGGSGDKPVIVPGRWCSLLPDPDEMLGWNLPDPLPDGARMSYHSDVLEMARREKGFSIEYPLKARNVVLGVRVGFRRGGSFALRLRASDKGVYMLYCEPGGRYRLNKWLTATKAGVDLASWQAAETRAGAVDVVFGAVGDTLTACVNGKKVIQARDRDLPSGSIGVKAHDAWVRIDDLQVLLPGKGWKFK
jgi:hypothetical protein